jgi:hypothetical protein
MAPAPEFPPVGGEKLNDNSILFNYIPRRARHSDRRTAFRSARREAPLTSRAVAV